MGRPAKVSSGASARGHRRSLVPYLFIAPFMVCFVVFVVLPLGYALYTSVFADRLVGGQQFVGLDNYRTAVADPAFRDGLWRMVVFGVVQIPIMLGLALFFAIVLDSGAVFFKRFFRVAFFLPYAIPSVVAALMWGYLYDPSFGPFQTFASSLDLVAPDFLSASWMLASLANVVTWEWTGYNMIILYAALQGIPHDLYEASALDGASAWQVARWIKIPLIAPALVVTGLFSIIGTLQLFNEPRIMSAIAPSVIGRDYTPNLYAYTLAFVDRQYNYSAAISFALGGIVLVLAYGFLLVSQRRGGADAN
jgi:multiple sugar transport system permease protein